MALLSGSAAQTRLNAISTVGCGSGIDAPCQACRTGGLGIAATVERTGDAIQLVADERPAWPAGVADDNSAAIWSVAVFNALCEGADFALVDCAGGLLSTDFRPGARLGRRNHARKGCRLFRVKVLFESGAGQG